jgi:CO/xanthine dehydrogenase FAD-binding subunit
VSGALACPVRSVRSLDDAFAALRDATPASRILAGGTDLMVEIETGRTRPDLVVDVFGIAALHAIREEDGGVRIGAAATCAALCRDPLVLARADVLAEAAWTVGAAQIRARATLGGNLGTASPAADLNPVLMALDARVRLRSVRGERELPVREFLTGYRQNARATDELIESVLVPRRPAGERRAFRKVGTRRAQAISKVVVAVCARVEGGVVEGLRAAAGSVADRTVELRALEVLVGAAPTRESVRAAARAAAARDASPIDDVRSTAAYRRAVLDRVLLTLLSDALGVPG